MAARKKSDSSLSAGAGESVEEERESSCSDETPDRDAMPSAGEAVARIIGGQRTGDAATPSAQWYKDATAHEGVVERIARADY